MRWKGSAPAGTRTRALGLGNRCSIRLSYRGAQSTKPFQACWCLAPKPFDTTFDTNAAQTPGQRAAATLSLASF